MTELEKYQAFHQHIRQRKAEIPGELEALRAAGKAGHAFLAWKPE